tara:strand:+ start:5066 stop:5350 length:285 start_codon:yes stop_codon:yes gene_type:complete
MSIPNLKTLFPRLEKVLTTEPKSTDKLGHFMYGEHKAVLYYTSPNSNPTKIENLACFVEFQKKWWMIASIAVRHGWTDEQIKSGFSKATELICV